MQEKQLYYFLAVKEILELFAEQELGSRCEINVPAVLNYVTSMKFINDTWGIETKEKIYQLVTDDILAGYPVWDLLIIPDWTRNMIEKEFQSEQQRLRLKLEETYKCFTCQYFYETETGLGILQQCQRPKDYKDWQIRSRDFELKKKCKYYISSKNKKIDNVL